jgi:P4 family phage/plasmid primase-like protien
MTKIPPTSTLTKLYDALGVRPHERMSVNHKIGGNGLQCQIVSPARAVAALAAIPPGADVYFGLNPVDLPIGVNGQRGKGANVTRVIGLPIDLDVKPGACPDLDTARKIIADVTEVYHSGPVAVIHSGHGLQPIWRTDLDPKTDVALLRRHGRLVRSIAAEHGAKLDSVFDLARVLRVPGTVNHKFPGAPVPTSVDFEDGQILTASELRERLSAAGSDELPGDADLPGEVISSPGTWPFAGQWCRYGQVATENWVKDELDERHNKTLDRYVRLACLWRYGCLPDETALQTALDALAERLRALREQTGQTVGHGEPQRMWFWACDRVSEFTDEKVATEVKHHHGGDGGRFFGKGGLLVFDLAHAVKESITCGFDELTEQFYVYDGGVWRPTRSRIKEQIVALLGNRYRTSYVNNVLDVTRFSGIPRLDPATPLRDYVNVANGMVDWATGTLVDHSPKFGSTVQLPGDYEPDADCPAVLRFLTEVLPADCVESGFIWELIGYAMYSGNPLHIAVLLWGRGRNGKGTLIRLLKALIGASNCSAVGLHELTQNRFRAATLYGKLANLAGDLPARWVANTEMFKAITGDDTIQGEHKFGHPFDFTPWALPVYSANKPFGSADSSEGWWSRWLVIPFPRTFARRSEEQLAASGEASEIRAAHSRYFAGREADILALWDSPRQREAYDWFTIELPICAPRFAGRPTRAIWTPPPSSPRMRRSAPQRSKIGSR